MNRTLHQATPFGSERGNTQDDNIDANNSVTTEISNGKFVVYFVDFYTWSCFRLEYSLFMKLSPTNKVNRKRKQYQSWVKSLL